MSALWITGPMAARLYGDCSTWDTRRELFRSRRGWNSWARIGRCLLHNPLKGKYRVHIDWNIGRFFLQPFPQILGHGPVLLEPVFRSLAIAGGLDLEQFLGKVGESTGNLVVVDGIPT